jgi:hypothetical protein
MELTGDTLEEARSFLELLLAERVIDTQTYRRRLGQISCAVVRHGHYSMESSELEHACRVAWRQSSRCIGRLPWKTLIVRDCRELVTPEEIFGACVDHLRLATNGGRIRPVMSVFAADRDGRPRSRIWNPQLIRYAGWRRPDGSVLGDALHVEFTAMLAHLGWRPETRSAFTILPLAIQVGTERPRLFELPMPCWRYRYGTPNSSGSPSSTCAGTPFRRSPGWRWKPGHCAIRPQRSTAGTWARRSVPATSPTWTDMTNSPPSPEVWVWTPAARPTCGVTGRWWS